MTVDVDDGPAVALCFANNFWGKDDAGVQPLLERMHNAKLTCDELRAFYAARASIEDDYARKLLSLSRKNLGSQEMGSLRQSLDTVRAELESIGKQHQSIAGQMKTDLEEPLTAFAGMMKERRKIVQGTVEKLLKIKVQQTQLVNKTRDRYEQECLKIKGYLAQGHMVMGQEERKNKAKLEKTQISLTNANVEYENAVKALEATTARWNKEWKDAADKFQDLEEERLDFTKSSLWQFANIASTVCVSDDASCEKIRLSLETLEVEKDILTFITEKGTGQEIPDAPKYINFRRGDMDAQSEVSDDDNYSVAQFSRSINPAFRSSSPQPSTFESHHDPNSALARKMHGDPEPQATPRGREVAVAANPSAVPGLPPQAEPREKSRRPMARVGYQAPQANNIEYGPNEFAPVPHDPYPQDGMTMLCRPTASDLSSAPSSISARPSSRGSHSETSFSSQDQSQQAVSPIKQEPPLQQQQQPPQQQPRQLRQQPEPRQLQQQPEPRQLQQQQSPGPDQRDQAAVSPDKKVLKKKSGFFQNHSPFRRKSTKEVAPPNSNRNTWHPSNVQARPQLAAAFKEPSSSSQNNQIMGPDRDASPDPIAANSSLALNIGNNVFSVDNTDRQRNAQQPPATPDDDPIAMALAELKNVTAGVGKPNGGNGGGRISADHYHGIATPAPGAGPERGGYHPRSNSVVAAAMRGTPPPSYDQQVQVQRLGVPPPAVTSKAMKAASEKFQQQTRSLFEARPDSRGYASQSRPPTRGGNNDPPPIRAASPAPPRATSPRPASRASPAYGSTTGTIHSRNGASSPNPFGASTGSQQQQHRGSVSSHHSQGALQMAPKRGDTYYRNNGGSGARSPSVMGDYNTSNNHSTPNLNRSASPAPYSPRASTSQNEYVQRPASSMSQHHNNMAVQLASSVAGSDVNDNSSQYGGSSRGRHARSMTASNISTRSGGASTPVNGVSLYEGAGPVGTASRARSKSAAADPNRFTRDGRSIMHFAKALYMYQAAIPEELGFAKGDVLAILRHQDDGWWEATVQGGNGQVGLVPSNYLQPC
ncbi:putative septation protein [Podospora australis]|uniref:Septation protein n=1 Tax=Podospora australis TaxID=1536484 RepID=A0AAN6X2A2_9PEZI|nr:putative septation protein [Podospora australis]